MSATSEILFEQLKDIDARIENAYDTGSNEDLDELKRQRIVIGTKLDAALNALREGKQLLKG